MSRRQQLIAGALGLIVGAFAIVLILNQDNGNDKKVAGTSITTATTGELPGIPTTSSTNATTTTTAESTNSTLPAPFLQPTTSSSVPRSNTTRVVTSTSIIQPEIPTPPAGPATIDSDNSAQLVVRNGAVESLTYSKIRNKGPFANMTITIKPVSANVVTILVSMSNTSSRNFELDQTHTYQIAVAKSGQAGNTYPIPLGSYTQIKSFQTLNAGKSFAFADGTYTLSSFAKGSWK